MIKVMKCRDGMYKIYFGTKVLGSYATKKAAMMDASAYRAAAKRVKKNKKLMPGDLKKVLR